MYFHGQWWLWYSKRHFWSLQKAFFFSMATHIKVMLCYCELPRMAGVEWGKAMAPEYLMPFLWATFWLAAHGSSCLSAFPLWVAESERNNSWLIELRTFFFFIWSLKKQGRFLPRLFLENIPHCVTLLLTVLASTYEGRGRKIAPEQTKTDWLM